MFFIGRTSDHRVTLNLLPKEIKEGFGTRVIIYLNYLKYILRALRPTIYIVTNRVIDSGQNKIKTSKESNLGLYIYQNSLVKLCIIYRSEMEKRFDI